MKTTHAAILSLFGLAASLKPSNSPFVVDIGSAAYGDEFRAVNSDDLVDPPYRLPKRPMLPTKPSWQVTQTLQKAMQPSPTYPEGLPPVLVPSHPSDSEPTAGQYSSIADRVPAVA